MIISVTPPPPLAFAWQGVGCSYRNAHGGGDKIILQDISGSALSGEMQALIGPSGAGKSTLMDILALRKTVGTLSGRLTINKQPAGQDFVRHTSYVAQDDNFVPTMTAAEVLSFHAALLLPEGKAQRKQRVAVALTAVGLSHAESTLVGGALPGGLLLRGLSGGERRRLAIAAGTLANPRVLFLDEPTSGLDSFAALSVMARVSEMANATNQIVIACVHQPRSAIWDLFAKVTLLSSGRLLFHGPRQDLVPWFGTLGFKQGDQPGFEADWILDLVATGFDKPQATFGRTMTSMQDITAAADAFKQHHLQVAVGCDGSAAKSTDISFSETAGETLSSALGVSRIWRKPGSLQQLQKTGSITTHRTSWLRQFASLGWRELVAVARNPFDLAGRILTCAYLGLLHGLIFYDSPLNSLPRLQQRSTLFFAMLLGCLLMPFMSISLYTSDKRTYLADSSAKLYRVSAYYAAKVVVTAPLNTFTILCCILVLFGLAGLDGSALHLAKLAALMVLLHLVACQVLHLFAVIAPNQDLTMCLFLFWSVLNVLLSSFYVTFQNVSSATRWLTQLRYVTAMYVAMEGVMASNLAGARIDCSASGMSSELVGLAKDALPHLSRGEMRILDQLTRPRPGCQVNADAFLDFFHYSRPWAASAGVLLAYLASVQVLTYVALVVTSRREKR